MAIAGWTIIALLLLAVAAMQWAGARALRSWGVKPSRTVAVLRALNLMAALGITFWAFYIWTR
jgi:hypothetical protein